MIEAQVGRTGELVVPFFDLPRCFYKGVLTPGGGGRCPRMPGWNGPEAVGTPAKGTGILARKPSDSEECPERLSLEEGT